MELEGAKRSFSALKEFGLKIATFISDRHRGIAKWVRESQPDTKHFFDIWHVARTIAKKMLAASKERGCKAIKGWIRGVRNHLYWCVTSTKAGFESMIAAKWTSFMRQIANRHNGHPNPLYKKCSHDELEARNWIKIGKETFQKLLFSFPC